MYSGDKLEINKFDPESLLPGEIIYRHFDLSDIDSRINLDYCYVIRFRGRVLPLSQRVHVGACHKWEAKMG